MRTTLLIGSLLTLATACVSKSEYDRQLVVTVDAEGHAALATSRLASTHAP